MSAILEPVTARVPVESTSRYALAGVLGFGRGVRLRETISGAETRYRWLTRISEDDVVYSKVKAFEGAFAVADAVAAGRHVSPEFPVFAPRGTVEPRFLAHYLAGDSFMSQVRATSSGIGARRERVSPREFLALKVPLPPLADQRRIAAHLDHVGGHTADLRGRAQHSASRLGVEQLPKILAEGLTALGAPVVSLSELVVPVNDTVHPGDDLRGAADFIGLQHIAPHLGRMIGRQDVGGEGGRKFRFEPGDVTYGYLRPYQNKVWAADRCGLCSVEQFVLRPKQGVDPRQLSVVLRSNIVLIRAVEATNNLQLPRLSLGTLLGIDVPDIRRTSHEATARIDQATETFAQLLFARSQRDQSLQSLLPAARNEVFSQMQ